MQKGHEERGPWFGYEAKLVRHPRSPLVKRLGVVDGALGIHLRKLEDSGYIACKKAFIGRRPSSTYRITREGRNALWLYLISMQELIDSLNPRQTP